MTEWSYSCQLATDWACYHSELQFSVCCPGPADQLIAEGTFVVTANTFGPQQVNVVLTNKKGYQKGQTALPIDNVPFACVLSSAYAISLVDMHVQALLCLC